MKRLLCWLGLHFGVVNMTMNDANGSMHIEYCRDCTRVISQKWEPAE